MAKGEIIADKKLPIMEITDSAAKRVQALLSREGSGYEAANIVGLRVSLTPKGCSGMSYRIEYAESRRDYEEVIESKGVKIFIDAAAIMFLIGSVMDYKESRLSAGFTFSNPNVKGVCGCGESFSF